MTDDWTESEDYQRFLAECARACRCCGRCWDVPCGGCTAGGVCDAMRCSCDDWRDLSVSEDDA